MKNKSFFSPSIILLTLFIFSVVNIIIAHDHTVEFKGILSTEEAIDYHISHYPEAQLADLYKSFYQDFFGPGHILEDSLSARRYFDYELSDTAFWDGPIFEYTGQGKNFVRLNMNLIKNGTIPQEVFFKAFMASLQQVENPCDDLWIRKWAEIDSILNVKGYSFPNEEQDREMISNKLANHNFTVHHSHIYDSVYRFHYRIISLPEFDKINKTFAIPR